MEDTEVIKKYKKDEAELRSIVNRSQNLKEVKEAARRILEYSRIQEDRHEKLDTYASHIASDGLDKEFLIDNIDNLLDAILRKDLTKPIPREIIDRIHVLRGHIFENKVNWRCPCGACKGRRAQDRYEDAMKASLVPKD